MTQLQERRSDMLKKLRQVQPFIEGTLSYTKKRCGSARCACAKEGPIHETTLLTWKEDQVTRTLYVPKELRAEVEKWIEEFRQLKAGIKEMSQTQRQILKEMKVNR